MNAAEHVVAGRYELVRLLAKGGFADVWLANRDDGTPVALKLLRTGSNAAEVAAAQRLHHPNIVPLLDAGSDGGRDYLVFEYVPGRSLRERLADGPLDLAETQDVADAVSSALDYSHGQGVLHNDLKPENVILGEDGVRLLDFGSARSLRDTLSLADASEFAGTIAYIAPEVMDGSPPGEASDVFAFVVLLFEALAGQLPPKDPDAVAEMLPAEVPAAARSAIQRAFSADPAARPRTASGLALALRGTAATVPIRRPAQRSLLRPAVVAAKPARDPVARKRPSRRRMGAGVAALVAALLGGGSLAAAFVLNRASDDSGSGAETTPAAGVVATTSPTAVPSVATTTSVPPPTATAAPRIIIVTPVAPPPAPKKSDPPGKGNGKAKGR
jgi:serine/threonine protein kinase